ncbi:MAG: aldo/keto reductase [Candidatus Latescibacteria bacterium]|nr:aldo/keto reductase [Candidatus Latescibacterota bacterium]
MQDEKKSSEISASLASSAALTRRQFIPRVAAAVLGAGAWLNPQRLLAEDRAQLAAASSEGMRYRSLGKTGIRVSEVSFGSHLTDANRLNPQERSAQINKGLELGINLFDIYDHTYQQFGLMSEVLGPVRQQVVLSLVTVWDKRQVAQEVDYALKTFNTDVIDLYRIYMEANTARGDVALRFGALQEAKKAGKIRAVGLVTHDHAVLVEMLRTYPELDYVMLPYNFQYQRFSPLTLVPSTSWGQVKDRWMEPLPGGTPAPKTARQQADCMTSPCEDAELLPLVQQTGVGVIAIKPFAAGGLLQLAPSDPLLQELQQAEVSLPRAALRFVLSNQEITCALPAMNSIAEVVENTAASTGEGMSEAECRLLQLYADAAEQARGTHLPKGYAWLEQWKAQA